MPLLSSLQSAEKNLREAALHADDWRIRSAIADATTIVRCAIFLRKQIEAGKPAAKKSEFLMTKHEGNPKSE